MTKTKRLTIHIGLHKTGTTFIQSAVLSKLNDTAIVRGWDSHRELLKKAKNSRIIVSDEHISGCPWHGHYLDVFYQNINTIKDLYGDPKIIFGFRAHDGFLLSSYKQYLHEGGTGSIDSLFNKKDTGLLMHKDLLFKKRIEYLDNNFSEVFIYSQECLKSRPQSFLDNLLKFLESDQSLKMESISNSGDNVGIKTNFQVSFLRKMNKLSALSESSFFLPSLYSRAFRKLKITPRNISQDYMRGISSKKYVLDEDLKSYLESYFREDLIYAEGKISF